MFSRPSTESELEALSKKTFAPNTYQKIVWVLGLYREWRNYRIKLDECLYYVCRCELEKGQFMEPNVLCQALCAFISEVRKKGGGEFPGRTLYEIIVNLQFALEKRGIFWKLLDGREFVPLRFTVDNLMKRSVEKGLGSVHSAEPLGAADEDVL